mmetsp:Transcript_11045/g.24175  ORF Transcript_11045/g.24175 Transcript_11045/m.24175 type:complete len:401 (+) Transcript_11045:95-1297(+)
MRYPPGLAACGGSPGSATGLEPTTIRIVAWCLNHWATRDLDRTHQGTGLDLDHHRRGLPLQLPGLLDLVPLRVPQGVLHRPQVEQSHNAAVGPARDATPGLVVVAHVVDGLYPDRVPSLDGEPVGAGGKLHDVPLLVPSLPHLRPVRGDTGALDLIIDEQGDVDPAVVDMTHGEGDLSGGGGRPAVLCDLVGVGLVRLDVILDLAVGPVKHIEADGLHGAGVGGVFHCVGQVVVLHRQLVRIHRAPRPIPAARKHAALLRGAPLLRGVGALDTVLHRLAHIRVHVQALGPQEVNIGKPREGPLGHVPGSGREHHRGVSALLADPENVGQIAAADPPVALGVEDQPVVIIDFVEGNTLVLVVCDLSVEFRNGVGVVRLGEFQHEGVLVRKDHLPWGQRHRV